MHALRALCAALAVLTCTGLVAAQPLSKEEKADGFVPLFNGKDLTGWKQKDDPRVGKVWDVDDDGTLFCRRLEPKTGAAFIGYAPLHTEREYKDFILRFDFLLTESCNNGLGFRVPDKGHIYTLGLEIQILDDAHAIRPDFGPGDKELYLHGSLCGVFPVKKDHGKLKPAERWNAQELIVKGRQVQVLLNGTQILDVDLDKVKYTKPGMKREQGHICFLAQRGRAEFKNIRIKELK